MFHDRSLQHEILPFFIPFFLILGLLSLVLSSPAGFPKRKPAVLGLVNKSDGVQMAPGSDDHRSAYQQMNNRINYSLPCSGKMKVKRGKKKDQENQYQKSRGRPRVILRCLRQRSVRREQHGQHAVQVNKAATDAPRLAGSRTRPSALMMFSTFPAVGPEPSL